MSVESFRHEMNVFEGSLKEAADLGIVDKTAASFIWHSAIGFSKNQSDQLTARNAELEAEVARLREAIEKIEIAAHQGGTEVVRDIARNELKEWVCKCGPFHGVHHATCKAATP